MPEMIILLLVGALLAGGIYRFLRVPAHMIAKSAKRPERITDYQRVMAGAVALVLGLILYRTGYPEGAVLGGVLLVLGAGTALWGMLILLTAK